MKNAELALSYSLGPLDKEWHHTQWAGPSLNNHQSRIFPQANLVDAISCSVEVPSSQATKISQQGKRPAGWGCRKRGTGEMNAKG